MPTQRCITLKSIVFKKSISEHFTTIRAPPCVKTAPLPEVQPNFFKLLSEWVDQSVRAHVDTKFEFS